MQLLLINYIKLFLNILDMGKQFLPIFLIILVLFLTSAAVTYGEKIEGYDVIKEKMLPKCLEFKEAGSLDMLKNQDTQLYLMCMDFILDDALNSSKTK